MAPRMRVDSRFRRRKLCTRMPRSNQTWTSSATRRRARWFQLPRCRTVRSSRLRTLSPPTSEMCSLIMPNLCLREATSTSSLLMCSTRRRMARCLSSSKRRAMVYFPWQMLKIQRRPFCLTVKPTKEVLRTSLSSLRLQMWA